VIANMKHPPKAKLELQHAIKVIRRTIVTTPDTHQVYLFLASRLISAGETGNIVSCFKTITTNSIFKKCRKLNTLKEC